MKKISIGFLWHMHQPYYRDPVSNTYVMPWVRLHSVRGYLDMISILGDYPHIRCTFNLVPSLLAQILDYTENGLRDMDFHLSWKRANDLTVEEKRQILSRFFMCNQSTMIEPFPRYMDLLSKRGNDLDQAIKGFSSQDILDLQVLFNLAWTGFTARRDKRIKELIRKGKAFSEEDKQYLLNLHIELMSRIIPAYKKAQDEGRIEITTTPFYHPIGPLVMNVGYALRSMDTPLPKEAFSHPEDLEGQIRRAVAFHTDLFDRQPAGMWPSEGSVCPEMVEILSSCGIEWTATDEDILFASINHPRTGSDLYMPYRVSHGSSEVSMFFRDRALADNIGFVYSKNPASRGADDFMAHLENIRKGSRSYAFDPFVSVILDGENPWEYYPDSGEAFLSSLWERLGTSSGIETRCFGDFVRDHPPERKISSLYTGSWINHNFSIWIGHEEDRKAWEYLARTRRYVESKGASADPLAWEEIYIAEGSDWFWWYGEDFSSGNDEAFDTLFRTHLKNCYLLHGDSPPDELLSSIITPREAISQRMPCGFIHPDINGRVTHFYEWSKAGLVSSVSSASSMFLKDRLLESAFYGFDEHNLYMRMGFVSDPTDKTIRINCLSPVSITLDIPIHTGQIEVCTRGGDSDDIPGSPGGIVPGAQAAFDDVLELGVPFASLDASPLDRMRFFIGVVEDEIEIQRYPSVGFVSFNVPDNSFERQMWYV